MKNNKIENHYIKKGETKTDTSHHIIYEYKRNGILVQIIYPSVVENFMIKVSVDDPNFTVKVCIEELPEEIRQNVRDMMEELRKLEYNADQRQYRREKAFIDDLFGQIHSISPSPEDVILRKKKYSLLYEAIKKLPTSQRKLIYDIFFNNISQSEIAKRGGVSKPAISQRLKRALATLKKELEKLGITSLDDF